VSRLRRTDARTGWLIATGGAFLITAVAFSKAQGIFHPYYVSALAPFTAALVGAGAGEAIRDARFARWAGPLAIAAGAVTEIIVLRNDTSGQLAWLPGLLLVTVFVAGTVLGAEIAGRWRAAVVAAAIAVLLIAPASWSFQTLGHATSGTFPAGGPATTGMGFGGGGGPGGGESSSLTAARAYALANGGGTIAVASQNGSASTLITDGATDIAAIGGFSGRESQVTIAWLADAVESGQIRWVVTDSGGFGGMANDGRVGATEVMAAVQQVGKEVSSVSGMYDLAGQADALRALAG